MRYTEFRDLIKNELNNHPGGLTWDELKNQLDLPYKQPCQTWIVQMEQEIGLSRAKEDQRAFTWKLP